MDARDDLGAGAKALILDPRVNGNPSPSDPFGTNPDNPTMTAGSTFVGQFTDHDITFDQTSRLGVAQNPLTSPNTRTPALDLDSVFGGGPGLAPDLYVENPDGSVGPRLKIGTGGVHKDLPVTYDRDDLLGGFPAARRYVGWQTFFDLGDGQVKNNKRIDPTISSVLFTIPVPAIAPHTQTSPTVLPQRNLLRQLTSGLPSGQAVAAAMGAPVLPGDDLGDIASVYARFGRRTPLWYYILAEAKATATGRHLGSVGGRIVVETLIGLLRADPTSYLSIDPGFAPFLGTDLRLGPAPNPNITGNRSYTRAHFLYHAGVVAPGTYR